MDRTKQSMRAARVYVLLLLGVIIYAVIPQPHKDTAMHKMRDQAQHVADWFEKVKVRDAK